MLFLFLFSYLGKTFVKASCKPFDVMKELNAMAGFEPTQDLQLFEVGEKFLMRICFFKGKLFYLHIFDARANRKSSLNLLLCVKLLIRMLHLKPARYGNMFCSLSLPAVLGMKTCTNHTWLNDSWRMEILFVSRKLWLRKLHCSIVFVMFPHFWNM